LINYFSTSPEWRSAFVIALACIPASVIATACYSYYYGKGYELLSYPIMSVMAYGFSLLTSLAVQTLILRSKTIQPYEIAGSLLIISGLLLIVFLKK
jgi:drug/metabolite transporter (DMT)-like permease